MVIVGVVLVGAGLLVLRINRQAAQGNLGPNLFAGIRTKATRSSPEAWKAAHEAGMQQSVLGGWIMVAVGVAAPVVGLIAGGSDDADKAMVWWTVVLLLGITVSVGCIIAGAMKGHVAAKAVIASAAE